MSSKPTKARKASAAEITALSPLEQDREFHNTRNPLTKGEVSRLNRLSYRKADIEALSPYEARYRLEKRLPMPGSKQALAQAVNPLTGVKGSSPIEGHYDNETIEARNAGKETGGFVIRDEWQGRGLEAAGLLFDQLDKPYRDANPDYVFRWLSPEVVKLLGADEFQDMTGPDGGRVMCADSWLGFKPRVEQEKADRAQRDTVNAPFRDADEKDRKVAPTGKASEFQVFQESTIARGDERARHIGLD